MRYLQRFSIIFLLLSLLLPGTTRAARTFNDADRFLGEAVAPTGVVDTDVSIVIGTVINRALALVGTIFFFFMVYAGFLWFTARGSEDQIGKAKTIIRTSIIGIVIIVIAYAITNFIVPAAIDVGTARANP